MRKRRSFMSMEGLGGDDGDDAEHEIDEELTVADSKKGASESPDDTQSSASSRTAML